MKASYPIYLRQVMLLERPQSIRPAMSKRYWRKDWRRRLCFGFPDRISCSTVRLDPLPIHRYTETNLLNVSIVRTPPMIPESIPNNIAPQHAYDSLFRQYHHKKAREEEVGIRSKRGDTPSIHRSPWGLSALPHCGRFS